MLTAKLVSPQPVSSTRRGTTPLLITVCIRSVDPSLMYDRAQQASPTTYTHNPILSVLSQYKHQPLYHDD